MTAYAATDANFAASCYNFSFDQAASIFRSNCHTQDGGTVQSGISLGGFIGYDGVHGLVCGAGCVRRWGSPIFAL